MEEIKSIEDLKKACCAIDFYEDIEECMCSAIDQAVAIMEAKQRKPINLVAIKECIESTFDNPETKGECWKEVNELAMAFQETFGTQPLEAKPLKYCQVRWQGKSNSGLESNHSVVCGEPLPCPKHGTQPIEAERARIVEGMEKLKIDVQYAEAGDNLVIPSMQKFYNQAIKDCIAIVREEK